MEFNETPEYFAGYEWAGRHANELKELWSSSEIGNELRSRLFDEAYKAYPPAPGDMENEWKATLWVLGGTRFVVDKMPISPEAMRAVWEVGMELGQMASAEQWKYRCWKVLKGKPAAWWKKAKGDASPDEVVAALAVGWRRREAKHKDKGREQPHSKWEVMVDMLGSREMCALAELEKVELVQDGQHWYYRVEGKDQAFEMIMRPVYHKGILEHGPGDIIG